MTLGVSRKKSRTGFEVHLGIVIIFLVLFATPFVQPEPQESPHVQETPFVSLHVTAQNVDNLTDIKVFFDNLVTQQISTYHIRGAQLSIVKDGALYFSNGYGFFNNDSGYQPVTANSTLFKVASLSKALTATAIMQLVEDGEIDLAADVNDYLEAFKVPNTFSEPITIEHLLAHTSGLENTLTPVYVNTAEGLPSLEDALRADFEFLRRGAGRPAGRPLR